MRTGDHVHHGPTGENWVVAYIDGDKLGWIGWPAGEALVSDCTLTKACTDQQHVDWLTQLAKESRDYPRDKSFSKAREALRSLQPSH